MLRHSSPPDGGYSHYPFAIAILAQDFSGAKQRQALSINDELIDKVLAGIYNGGKAVLAALLTEKGVKNENRYLPPYHTT
jgi:hypothetical protein